MSDFNKALRFVLNNEGGFSNHPADKGEKTMFGVTEGRLNGAIGRGIVKKCRIEELTLEDAGKIYKVCYWNPVCCSTLPWPLDALFFDACVNHGLGGGTRLMQRTLNLLDGRNLAVDGAFGVQTKCTMTSSAMTAEINAAYRKQFAETFCNFREKLYETIVRNNPKQKVFLKGWLARVERCRMLV